MLKKKKFILFTGINVNLFFFYKILYFFNFKIYYLFNNPDHTEIQKKIIGKFAKQFDLSRIKCLETEDWKEYDYGKKDKLISIIKTSCSSFFLKKLSKIFNFGKYNEEKSIFLICQKLRSNIDAKFVILKIFAKLKGNKVIYFSFDPIDFFLPKIGNLKIFIIPIHLQIFFKLIKNILEVLKLNKNSNNTNQSKNTNIKSKNINIDSKKIIFISHFGLKYLNKKKDLICDFNIKNDTTKDSEDKILFLDYTNATNDIENIDYHKLQDIKFSLKGICWVFLTFFKLLISSRRFYDIVILFLLLSSLKNYKKFLNFTKKYKNLKVAFFDYDFLSPLELVYAAKSAGLTTLSYQERPNIVYHNNYFMDYDVYFCVSKFFGEKLSSTSNFKITNKILSNFNLDEFQINKSNRLNKIINTYAPDSLKILFILYPDDEVDEKISFCLSNRANKHILNEVLILSKLYPKIQFTITSKGNTLFKNSKFKYFMKKIGKRKNILIVDDQVEDLSLNFILLNDLIIGKPSTIMDKCIYLEKPLIIHDYTHNLKCLTYNVHQHCDQFFYVLCFNDLIKKINLFIKSKNLFLDKVKKNKKKIFNENLNTKFIIREKINSIIK